MPYGSYSGPDKPNKGKENGACNRRLCQDEPATHYNHGSYSWYCAGCARDIGDDPVNKQGWDLRWRPKCGHAQFETREEIDKREAAEQPPKAPVNERFVPTIEGPSMGPGKNHSPSLQSLLRAAKRRA